LPGPKASLNPNPDAKHTPGHLPARLPAAAARFEQQHARFPATADLEQLTAAWQAAAEEAGLDPSVLPADELAAYAQQGEDMPAINAIVGGVLANDLIKAVGRKGEPINNFFLFSLFEGAGAVERMGS